jgi:membrane protease YdiL (CAAX protease family)
MLKRLVDRFFWSHWEAIDAETRGQSTGPRSAVFKALVTVAVGGGVLTLLQYVILRGDLQDAISKQIPDIAAHFLSTEIGDWLRSYQPLIRPMMWSFGCIFFYFVVPATVVKLVFQERLQDWGLSVEGYFRHLWVYVVLFLPVGALVWAVSYTPAFQQNYPFYANPNGLADFLVWEIMYALQFCALEFFFRGFLLNGLKERLGVDAILLMIIPYCMIHFQKPLLETFGAIVAGLILGILAMRTRSIWGGATIHVAVATSMDVAALLQR